MGYMRRRALAIVVFLLASGTLTYASEKEPTLAADRQRYVPGQDLVITLTNQTDRSLTFQNPWVIETGGERAAQVSFPDRRLAPGESRQWKMLLDPCTPEITPPCEEPTRHFAGGRYRALVQTSAGTLVDRFRIGEYFTLGFRKSAHTFVVYPIDPETIRQMEQEVAKPEVKRNLITAGIVRWARPYNSAWSFTMSPPTIITGEVFIEVCDASPEYVEKNRDQWTGKQWCPWSSYVKAIGK